MKTITLYFQVHHPLRLRTYRFFDIGHEHYYWDDYLNKTILKQIAHKCYIPANNILLELIKKYNKNFKIAFSITGIALEQMEKYTPELIRSFQELAKTGCVEFIAETYAHSLACLKNKSEFIEQVKLHSDKIYELFKQKPETFRCTELIYCDEIGETVAKMGFKTMLTEGARHILGCKSPNYLYFNTKNPKLKLLLRNYELSDDISFRFSNKNWDKWPLTAEKYSNWIKDIDPKAETINIFMDYKTFGEHQKVDTGIFDFLKHLPENILKNTDFKFATPSEASNMHQPISGLNIQHPISWTDEERDLSAWLGNKLQNEAFEKLYKLKPLIDNINDTKIKNDWYYLQSSDHFYYMATKLFADGQINKYSIPYNSPYNAFLNYMNVLSDFTDRVNNTLNKHDLQNNSIEKLEEIIDTHKNEITKLKKIISAKKRKETNKTNNNIKQLKIKK